ncbi:FIG00388525: hypothetical protein [hydrothermal vent metagenome]|uniref:VTT domain-containing protein n=1 Tax=hydrothermal vent metagenome TaxID=652676 RepID=A0A1W1EK48_9ZZZZ
MDYIYLFFNALISATLFPLGSEALFIYDITQNLNITLLLLVATAGNSLGSIINYYTGYKGEEYLLEKNIINQSKIDKYKIYFDKYGAYTLIFAWLPIIGDPLTIIAGVLRYNLKIFIIVVTISKFLRYFFLLILIFENY